MQATAKYTCSLFFGSWTSLDRQAGKNQAVHFVAAVRMSGNAPVVADAIFSSFTGDTAPLGFISTARVVFRRSSFRDFALSEEIFDVSAGGAVHLDNCTFTNITVPDNEYISTSYNDWDYFQGVEVEIMYYPDDDAGPRFDFHRLRADHSILGEQGALLYLIHACAAVACMQQNLRPRGWYISVTLVVFSQLVTRFGSSWPLVLGIN